MKSAGMDANRVIIHYGLASVLLLFLSLILLGQPTLVFTQDNTGPRATLNILPEYTTEPREGDSVTLDCEISSIQQTDVVLWAKRINFVGPEIIIVDENGLSTSQTDNRFSVSLLQVINSTAALYSNNITIDPVQQSDQGYYMCHIKRGISIISTSTEVPLFVYRLNEFPVCFPDGQASVTIGSSLSCKTLLDTRTPTVSDTETPTVANDGWVTSPTNGGGSPGQEIIKTVTNSEHGKTFQCFSTPDVPSFSPACKIGPLVVSGTTQSPVHETTLITTMASTATVQQQSAGLSGADIAGIVIGVILLLIIIAVHTLCCRCNPKRWLYAKSYPFDLGSSFRASSRERGDTVRTLPETELGNAEPQTSTLYSDSQTPTENDTGTTTYSSGTIGNLQPAPTPDPWTSEQPDLSPTDPAPKPPPPAIYAQVKQMSAGTDNEEPTGPKPPAVYAQVHKTTPETDTSELNNPPPNPSETNAQMDEKAPHDDAELLKENSKGSSKLPKIKNIKSFGRNRNGHVATPPKPEPVVIYADLNLQNTRGDEARSPPADDSQTVYAAIQH